MTGLGRAASPLEPGARAETERRLHRSSGMTFSLRLRWVLPGLLLALAGCAHQRTPEPETADRTVSEERAEVDSFQDMPRDGVNERIDDDAPAAVTTGVRPAGSEDIVQVDPATPPPRVVVIDLERLEEECADPSVYFRTDSAELTTEAEMRLAYLSKCVTREDVRAIQLTGHADPRASESYNEELARERAAAVKRYLQRMGVEEPELRVVSMGEQAARWELFWPLDRRVDVEVSESGS
ncbi:MAG: hypothetical protein CMN31_00350 [Sandaracinus sp.]|nr:hypothetical protein [Myxococcales bacterium]MAT25703.1 hypothetical protein [Sandaracinus sp.]MBJ69815.1 hypothetical protein [Sandaracinus sp.]